MKFLAKYLPKIITVLFLTHCAIAAQRYVIKFLKKIIKNLLYNSSDTHKSIFDIIDTNDDGKISEKEVKEFSGRLDSAIDQAVSYVTAIFGEGKLSEDHIQKIRNNYILHIVSLIQNEDKERMKFVFDLINSMQ